VKGVDVGVETVDDKVGNYNLEDEVVVMVGIVVVEVMGEDEMEEDCILCNVLK
tara:strand:- start:185 stop:343 length:159 start_codon:yes stop_codon:yes gene_type:complete